MKRRDVTLGLSIHRPELVPIMGASMTDHEIIVLEEPQDAKFERMLNKEIEIDEYLQELDIEYPIFSRTMCRLMQRLSAQHKRIVQVEPYLETLLAIHEFFTEGSLPEDLIKGSLQQRVYMAEKLATAALLEFYQTAHSGSFDAVTESVRQFARQDAARFQLRDELRAEALIPFLEIDSGVFIEAGLMHLGLQRQLQRSMSKAQRLKTKFIADDLLKKHGLSGRLYGPGDRLTLLYIFHPDIEWPHTETLLAARALVYNKLIHKSEMDEEEDIPNLKNEVACLQMVHSLTISDCRRLYQKIRTYRDGEAKHYATRFLGDSEKIVRDMADEQTI
jgi:hypothetical protein